FRGIQIASWNRALLVQILAALVHLLRGIEGGLRRGCVQFGLLNLLRKTGLDGDRVVGVGLLEITSARLGLRRQILVLKNCKKLLFFQAAAPLHLELQDGRSDFGRDGRLFQRKQNRLGGDHLGKRRFPGSSNLDPRNWLLFLFHGIAADKQDESRRRGS